MLKEILSISGKPGLFKLISRPKNMLIVESLIDKKRLPSYAGEKVVSLDDIAIFSDSGEIPLRDVLEKIKEKEGGAIVSISANSDEKKLQAYFAEILPDYDRDRVFPSNIKKVISWYNLLIENELTEFVQNESDEGNQQEN